MCLSDRFDLANFTQTGMGALRPKSAVNLAFVSNREIFKNPRHCWARPIGPYRPHGLLNFDTPACESACAYTRVREWVCEKYTKLDWTYWTDWTQLVIARVLVFLRGLIGMEKITKKERSDINRLIHKSAQSFAQQVSEIAQGMGRVDMSAKVSWVGEQLEVLVEVGGHPVKRVIHHDEPY